MVQSDPATVVQSDPATPVRSLMSDPATPRPRDIAMAVKLDWLAALWLLVLPALRPLVWSGDPTDAANLAFYGLLTAATATGLLHRALWSAPLRPTPWRLSLLVLVLVAWLAITATWSPAPATAWFRWWGWAAQLAAVWALLPAIHRHLRVLSAGLLLGLVGEALLVAGEYGFEKPALRARFAVDPAMVDNERLRGQWDARVHSWRANGTFLLANCLASWVILVLPIAVATLAHATGRRVLATLLSVLAVALLIASGSKAGVLAAASAGVLTVICWHGRWRKLAVAALLLALAAAIAVPPLRQALSASAEVRLGYWQAALVLTAERPLLGHGLDGFARDYPRVKPPAAEETILAHSEPLQAAVDAGVLAALMLLAVLILPLTRRAGGAAAAVTDVATPRLLWLGALAVLAWSLLFSCHDPDTGIGGMLHPVIAGWPGGYDNRIHLWAVALVAVLTALTPLLLRLPAAPAWAWWWAGAALGLHALMDFPLHSPQIVLILGLVLAAAWGSGATGPVTAAARPCPRRLALAALGIPALALSGAAVTWLMGGNHAAHERNQATQRIFRLQLAAQHDRGEPDPLGLLSALAGYGDLALGQDPHTLAGNLADRAVEDATTLALTWPADDRLAIGAAAVAANARALGIGTPAAHAQALARLAERFPDHVGLVKAQAEALTQLASRSADQAAAYALRQQALALTTRAIALYPYHLPLRQDQAALARAVGDPATADAADIFVATWADRVHPSNRPSPPRLTTPVPPLKAPLPNATRH